MADNDYNYNYNMYNNQASYNFQAPPPNYSPQVSYYVPAPQPQAFGEPQVDYQPQVYPQGYPAVYASNYYPQPYTSMDFSSMTPPVNENQKMISLYNVSLIILTLMDVFGYSFLLLFTFWFAFSFVVICLVTFISILAITRKSVIAMCTVGIFRFLYVLYLLGFGSLIVVSALLATGNPTMMVTFYISTSIYFGFTITFLLAIIRLSKIYIKENQANNEAQYRALDMDIYNIQSI